MDKRATKKAKVSEYNRDRSDRRPLSVESLEARIAPAVAGDKKAPTPPPYPPGSLYGLVARSNLRY
ncbi:MAG: hypothetical protein JW797_19940 [Bradymonadales bacterium]|nr:hypothetical protein [Bradymonadales bacterium]